jgi:AGCS family alanine or glycine:cation symporter
VALGLAFFAFSTILGWGYYGERAISYLFGEKSIFPYRIVFILAAFFGCYVLELESFSGLQLVWTFSDVMNGAMAVPNLIGVLLLSRIVAHETRDFLAAKDG